MNRVHTIGQVLPLNICKRFLIVGLLGAVFCAGIIASPWPRFRGPNGTGVAAEADIPVRWDEQRGILWKTEIPGFGNSSPVVWGERLFLQSAAADGSERRLLCLSAKDGRVLWSQSAAGRPARMHARNTLASSTPAVDGERVYAVFWDGTELALQAFGLDGKQQWRQPLGPFKSQHGYGASPIVYRDRVILANDQDGSAAILCFKARTGQLLWQVQRPAFRACYSTPFVREPAGAEAEVIVASTAGVTAYAPSSGTVLWNWTWRFSGMPLRTVASPIEGDGMLIACAGDGSGERHTVALRLGADKATPTLAWQSRRTLPYVPSLVARGNFIYFVNDQGVAGCLEARTGATIWTQRLGTGMSASPILVGDKIYAADDDGIVHVFAAAAAFRLIANNPIGEPVTATPAVADGRLFIRGRHHVFCIGNKG